MSLEETVRIATEAVNKLAMKGGDPTVVQKLRETIATKDADCGRISDRESSLFKRKLEIIEEAGKDAEEALRLLATKASKAPPPKKKAKVPAPAARPKRKGLLGRIAVAFFTLGAMTALAVSCTAAPSGETPKDKTVTTSETTTVSLQNEALTVEEEASVWRDLLLQRFGESADDCKVAWDPKELDLEEVKLYALSPEKTEDNDFGPHMGKTPCEVSGNLVERVYKDPALQLALAQRHNLIDAIPEAKQAAEVAKLSKAPFEERREQASEIIGWYAAQDTLRLEKRTGETYTSDSMSNDGVVSATAVHGDSTVIVTEKDGKVTSEGRLDCGLQNYVSGEPSPDTPPHPTSPPPCPPGTTGTWPKCLAVKVDAWDPYPQGNAPVGGDTNHDPGPGTYVPPADMTQPPPTTYTTPPPPPPAPPKVDPPKPADPPPGPATKVESNSTPIVTDSEPEW